MWSMTTPPAPSPSVISGPRLYYEEFVALSVADRPTLAMPAFDDLTSDQVRVWMLAYVANIELSIRIADAVMSIDELAP